MKKILSRIIPAFFLVLAFQFAFSQASDSTAHCHVRISILTVEPGQELYSIFGHSAIRIQDSVSHSDLVYGWGTFDFNEPHFYLKFLKGNLNYFVSVDPFNDFMAEYKVDQRSVWEQVLILNCMQKEAILKAIAINMLPQNRFYQYDFLKDNCTTRIRDIIFANVQNTELEGTITLPGVSYRDMIHEYLDEGAKPWSKLGIDILLGSPTDKEPGNQSAMFLPDYLMQALDVTQVNGQPITESEEMIFQAAPCDCLTWMYAPLMTTSVICVIFLIISLIPIRWAITMTKLMDSFLFYITGLIGIIIFFMWLFTEHTATANNFNIVWALPTNFIFAFFIWRHHKWSRPYFLIVSILYAILLATWFFLPQELNIALIPVILYMMFRSYKLGGKKISKEYNAEVYF
ncbi:MAG: DUF4105 domain-containing protein [Bacteroidetes bacterium]|nr:DUF4105 domain-containing protein [Bacteroidota bacterium]